MKIFLALLLCFSSLSLPAADQKPNVVFILSDDQGWADYGFMGHPHLKTPHLDRLSPCRGPEAMNDGADHTQPDRER